MLEDLDLLARDWTEDADSKAGPREGMSLYEVVGDGEKTSKSANFVCKDASVEYRKEDK